MKNFPKINFIGNKDKIADWIVSNLPEDVVSILDAFSGGSAVSYAMKEKGLQVFSNDIQKVNFNIAKALIENKNVTLDNHDIDVIFSGQPIKGYMFKHYANVFYFPEECKELDLYRQNIDKLENDYKKALAFALMRRAMIRKMPYSRFTIPWEKIKQLRDEDFSYKYYKRRRHYHNESFMYHFLDNLDEYNRAVFDNGKENIAYNEDVFDVVKHVNADAIYLDPPYIGTMNNYYGFYGTIDEYISGHKEHKFKHSFNDKVSAIKIFKNLFLNLKKYHYWILSYNNVAKPTKEELLNLLSEFSDKITILEMPHSYKVTGKDKKNKNIEYLFIVNNENYGKTKV